MEDVVRTVESALIHSFFHRADGVSVYYSMKVVMYANVFDSIPSTLSELYKVRTTTYVIARFNNFLLRCIAPALGQYERNDDIEKEFIDS